MGFQLWRLSVPRSPNQPSHSPAAEPKESHAAKYVERPLHSHQTYFVFLWVKMAPLELLWGPTQPGESGEGLVLYRALTQVF